MKKPLTKIDLEKEIYNEMGIPMIVARESVNVLFDSIIEAVCVKKEKAHFYQLGTFYLRKYPSIKGKIHSRTGLPFDTKESRLFSFKPIAKLKKKIKETIPYVPNDRWKLKKKKKKINPNSLKNFNLHLLKNHKTS